MIIKTISMVIRPGSAIDLEELDKTTNGLLVRAESPSTGIVTYHDVREIVDTVTALKPFGHNERLLFTRRITFR
jgi:hypothetical protein